MYLYRRPWGDSGTDSSEDKVPCYRTGKFDGEAWSCGSRLKVGVLECFLGSFFER